MGAAVSLLKKATPVSGLAQMIDRAGEINDQINALKSAYDDLRKKIAMRMPLEGTSGEKVEEYGAEYQAKHFYPVNKVINPEELYKYLSRVDKGKFWQLVRVNLQDAEKTLPPVVFHRLAPPQESDTPRLTITKIKKKD